MSDLNFATADLMNSPDREPVARPSIKGKTFCDSIVESDLEESEFDSYSDFDALTSNEEEPLAEDSSRVLSSALVANILANQSSANPEQELSDLLSDDAVSIFLQSAKVYANHVGITEQDAVSEIIAKLSRLDQLWKEVLTRKGFHQLETECNR